MPQYVLLCIVFNTDFYMDKKLKCPISGKELLLIGTSKDDLVSYYKAEDSEFQYSRSRLSWTIFELVSDEVPRYFMKCGNELSEVSKFGDTWLLSSASAEEKDRAMNSVRKMDMSNFKISKNKFSGLVDVNINKPEDVTCDDDLLLGVIRDDSENPLYDIDISEKVRMVADETYRSESYDFDHEILPGDVICRNDTCEYVLRDGQWIVDRLLQ